MSPPLCRQVQLGPGPALKADLVAVSTAGHTLCALPADADMLGGVSVARSEAVDQLRAGRDRVLAELADAKAQLALQRARAGM